MVIERGSDYWWGRYDQITGDIPLNTNDRRELFLKEELRDLILDLESVFREQEELAAEEQGLRSDLDEAVADAREGEREIAKLKEGIKKAKEALDGLGD